MSTRVALSARRAILRRDGGEVMTTEIAGVVLAVLIVVYSVRTAWSGMHGRRPKGPMV